MLALLLVHCGTWGGRLISEPQFPHKLRERATVETEKFVSVLMIWNSAWLSAIS